MGLGQLAMMNAIFMGPLHRNVEGVQCIGSGTVPPRSIHERLLRWTSGFERKNLGQVKFL